MKRDAQPDELASFVMFLDSDDAYYVAGVKLVLDGGRPQP
jgi:NAD(P)-dependent dehydrogenase (short-subunit alcohol dehydrogenase family)